MQASVGISRSDFMSIVSHPISGGKEEQKGRCFLPWLLLRTSNHELVKAASLVAGDNVLSWDGCQLEVRSVTVHPLQYQPLVELRAGEAVAEAGVLTVTPSHRVMVQRGTIPQTMPAGDLREGDPVYCSGGRLAPLTSVRIINVETEVVEISFRPDEPVEAFLPSILSKGYGWSKTTRRSRRNVRSAEESI